MAGKPQILQITCPTGAAYLANPSSFLMYILPLVPYGYAIVGNGSPAIPPPNDASLSIMSLASILITDTAAMVATKILALTFGGGDVTGEIIGSIGWITVQNLGVITLTASVNFELPIPLSYLNADGMSPGLFEIELIQQGISDSQVYKIVDL